MSEEQDDMMEEGEPEDLDGVTGEEEEPSDLDTVETGDDEDSDLV